MVHRVGIGRPHATIQSAVDAASDGDAIEVDAGTYPPFVVAGKQLAIHPNNPAGTMGATYSIGGPGAGPAIRVTGLGSGRLVTVAGARISHTDPTAPAVLVDANPTGSVRLLDVVVTNRAGLGGTTYDGIIELRGSQDVWLDRVRAGDVRTVAIAVGGGTALAALFVDTTNLHASRCHFAGLRSNVATVQGGDGMRVVGTGEAWLVDTDLIGGMSSGGAAAGTLGGHAVHDAGGQAGTIRLCDCLLAVTVSTVSLFAVANNPAFMMDCANETIGRTSLAPPATEVTMGAAVSVAVDANVTPTGYVTLIADGFGYLANPAFGGALLFGGQAAVLRAGVLNGPVAFPLQLPQFPAAVGWQLTVQSLCISQPFAVAWSTAAAFTVR